jgi:hypothetical protein
MIWEIWYLCCVWADLLKCGMGTSCCRGISFETLVQFVHLPSWALLFHRLWSASSCKWKLFFYWGVPLSNPPNLSFPLSLTNPILACAITKKFLLPLISSSQTIAHMISNNRMQTQFVFRDGFDVLMHYIGMGLMVMVRSLDVLMLFRLLNWMSWCLMH